MRSFLLIFVRAISNGWPMRTGRTAIILCFSIAAPVALTHSAKGHTHVNADGTKVSWYPMECCHNGDCRPVATIQRAVNGLWMTTVDGLTVLVGPNDRRRASRDMRWHICVGADDTATPKIRCIFEPPNS